MSQHGDDRREELLEKLRSMLVAGEVPTSALKTRREELGVSQHELARRTGVSQAVISRIEAGEQLPTNAQIEKLGTALEVGEQDLGLAETMIMMSRLAAKGKLPPKAIADFAGAKVVVQLQPGARRMVRGPGGGDVVGGAQPRSWPRGQTPRLQALRRPLRDRRRRRARAEAGPQPRRRDHEFDKYTLMNWGHDPLKN